VLFPRLADPSDRLALRFAERELNYTQLRDGAANVAAQVAGARRVGVWALSVPETAVAVVGALLAGVAAVPINPKAGERELAHIVRDSAPDAILCAPGVQLPAALAEHPRVEVDLTARGGDVGPEPGDEAPALVVYTSGTNGEPLAIGKSLAQLDAEVHALEARFGALCDTGLAPVNLATEAMAGFDDDDDVEMPVIWATVTHQHIYGLLFRVLWPLAAGRSI